MTMTIADILSSASQQSGPFRKALELVLLDECEYENDGVTICTEHHPNDAGGKTFAGIDHADFPDFPFDDPTPQAVWNNYLNENWKALRCAELPKSLSIALFVQGVNAGNATAVRLLQSALNDYGSHLVIDGNIGTNTITSCWKVPDSDGLFMAFLAKNRRHYQEIVSRRPDQACFQAGWNARVDHLKQLIV